ncbi:MAG: hypothetical protein WBF53_15175, partial [Litorimonas sp.]
MTARYKAGESATTMRPRVTLQLPRHVEPAVDLRGASVLLIGNGYVAQALTPRLREAGATVRHTQRET